jgi:purine-binding chemotaxis protein CheW
VQALILDLGDEVYALPLGSVREVVPEPRVTRLPSAPAGLVGLVNVRGEIVPLFDAAALVGAPEGGPLAFAVVVRSHEGPGALAVPRLPRSAELGERASAGGRAGEEAVHPIDGGLAVLLDVEALLSGGSLRRLA